MLLRSFCFRIFFSRCEALAETVMLVALFILVFLTSGVSNLFTSQEIPLVLIENDQRMEKEYARKSNAH